MVYISHYDSPIGSVLLAERDGKLTGAWIEGQKYFLGSVREETQECENSPVLRQAEQWLERYFAGKRPSISELPLAPEGSGFQKDVWQILCGIPYGKTVTYGKIAQELALRRGLKRMSARAVGGAVGRNPVSIIIPCHRVVGSNGSLTGYAGGLQKKIELLTHEGVDVSQFFAPEKGSAV